MHSAMDVASSDPLFISIFQSYNFDIASSGGGEISTASSKASGAVQERLSNEPALAEARSVIFHLLFFLKKMEKILSYHRSRVCPSKTWIKSLQNMDSSITKAAALSISGLSVIAKESLFRYTLFVHFPDIYIGLFVFDQYISISLF